MPKLIATIFLGVFTIAAMSQSIHSAAFKWTQGTECIPKSNFDELFLKAQRDPVITQYSSTDFQLLLTSILSELDIDNDISGEMQC